MNSSNESNGRNYHGKSVPTIISVCIGILTLVVNVWYSNSQGQEAKQIADEHHDDSVRQEGVQADRLDHAIALLENQELRLEKNEHWTEYLAGKMGLDPNVLSDPTNDGHLGLAKVSQNP